MHLSINMGYLKMLYLYDMFAITKKLLVNIQQHNTKHQYFICTWLFLNYFLKVEHNVNEHLVTIVDFYSLSCHNNKHSKLIENNTTFLLTMPPQPKTVNSWVLNKTFFIMAVNLINMDGPITEYNNNSNI